MNFLLYGAGALGQALGCMLATAGNRVDLLLRPRFKDAIHQNGLSVTGVLGSFAAPMDNLGLLTSIGDTETAYDYTLITTKTYDTLAAVTDIALQGSRGGIVVSMQNGCGNIEQVVKVFGHERAIGARIITGFEIEWPGVVRITVTADAIHVGDSRPGQISAATQKLAAAIAEAGHPCIAVPDINLSLNAKLLYNCALNPLGAILGVHYGALSESRETTMIMDRIIDETFTVIHGMGSATPWSTAEEYRRVFYDQLLPVTYHHRPSMLQDLENNKTTEVEALVGYVSRKGRELGIKTPACDLLAAMLRFKQDKTSQKE